MLEIKQDERANDYKLDMERMRIQTFYLMNIQIDKKDRFKTVQKMMPFEWDKDIAKQGQEEQPPTEEDWERFDTLGGGGIKKKE